MAAPASQPEINDVFQSMNENLSKGATPTQTLTLIALTAAVLLAALLLNRLRQRSAQPKRLHNPNRLEKDAAKSVSLTPQEMQQLTRTAEQAGVKHPLTLLLCPSLLAKSLLKATGDEREKLRKIARKLGEK